MFHIYIILNLLNDKVYIGQSRQIKTRFSQHKSALKYHRHKNIHLQRAFDKDGPVFFEFFILSTFNNQQEVDGAEDFYIDWFKQLDLCYNIDLKARGNGIMSDETKQKLRDAQTGKKMSKAAVDKMIEFRTGRKLSEEHKKKIGQANIGRHHTQETKDKLSLINSGRIVSEETISKISTTKKSSGYHPKLRPKMVDYAEQKKMPIKLLDPDGNLVERNGMRVLCKEFGLNCGVVCGLLKGKFKQHKGWTTYNTQDHLSQPPSSP